MYVSSIQTLRLQMEYISTLNEVVLILTRFNPTAKTLKVNPQQKLFMQVILEFVLFTMKYIYSILVIEWISQMCKQINLKLNKSKRFIFVLDFK